MCSSDLAVRDTDPSIDVLVVQKENGYFRVVPWLDQGFIFFGDKVPTEEEAKKLARQSIRLPHFLLRHSSGSIIDELEELRSREMPKWIENPYLRHELFLILDDDLCCEVGNYRLCYDREMGLVYSGKEVTYG